MSTLQRVIGLTLLFCTTAVAAPAVKTAPSRPANNLAWWQDARFGMFIHFGVYSTLGRGEWVRSVEKISVEAYEPFAQSFNPVDFDARALAKLAKAAGMKYAVMTAKHHDGFCLFDSKLTTYKSTATASKRDLVREFVDAFRAEGLKVGLYYSLLDWHHEDYPHFGDHHHPERDNMAWKDKRHDFDRYLKYMHGQISEIVHNYGKLDVLWFDFSYDKLTGEAWRAKELLKVVRQAQPTAILNNRLGGDGVSHGMSTGDFVTPEQGIPEVAPTDAEGRLLPWETCLTLNNSWGFNRNDKQWKTSKQIVGALVNAVSKGGNLLLNVGPDGRGRIPEDSVRVLNEVGRWLQVNGESVYGAGAAALPKPEYGRFTQKGKSLYVHVTDPPISYILLPGVRNRIVNARLVSDRAEAYLGTNKFGQDSGQDVFMNVAKPVHHTFAMPDPIDTVFEVQLK
ncbi:MAG: alpha-L-fucosidase [Deltaproteobacteria bacterium]|nr:alpha-L-fucosidase [Deltaproteobacteria bacterium]